MLSLVAVCAGGFSSGATARAPGQITDPRNGDRYQAELWVDDSGDLHLRGFIGIPLLGSTQVWRKYTGQLTAECGLA